MPNTVKATTKLLGLIGSPVNASMSPSMHNAAFNFLGLDAIYLAFDVNKNTCNKAVEGLANLGACGYNVTVPLKGEVLSYLDEVDTAAQLMHSVNTVKVVDGKSIGYNTDGLSFTVTLKNHDIEVKGSILAVADIDAEGPAYITQAAVEGAKEILVLTSNDLLAQAQNQYANVSDKTGCSITVANIEDIDSYKAQFVKAEVFCNATRIGTGDSEAQSPIEESLLKNTPLVLDTIYNPRETTLLKEASEIGCETVGGLEILLNQAALAEKIWLDCDMPTDYIKSNFFD